MSVALAATAFSKSKDRRGLQGKAVEDSMEEQQTPSNEVSDETGQFDPRFLLWRKFCDDHGVAVNSLPSDLTGETKSKWEKQKRDADTLGTRIR
jgi:hypothetical protein